MDTRLSLHGAAALDRPKRIPILLALDGTC
jgi:hypothetical protein